MLSNQSHTHEKAYMHQYASIVLVSLFTAALDGCLAPKTGPKIETSAQKYENVRISIFSLLSLLDFNC